MTINTEKRWKEDKKRTKESTRTLAGTREGRKKKGR